jgi:hypothetical protein
MPTAAADPLLRYRSLMFGHLRNRYLLLVDALALPLAALLAYTVRFEGLQWPAAHVQSAILFVLLVVPMKLGVMWALGLYQRMWRYASTPDLEVLAVAGLGSGIVGFVVGLGLVPVFLVDGTRAPVSVVALDALIGGVLIAVAAGAQPPPAAFQDGAPRARRRRRSRRLADRARAARQPAAAPGARRLRRR